MAGSPVQAVATVLNRRSQRGEWALQRLTRLDRTLRPPNPGADPVIGEKTASWACAPELFVYPQEVAERSTAISMFLAPKAQSG